MGVAGADDVAQHGFLADEADRDALDLGRTGLVGDRVPPAVPVPAPHGHAVVGHPFFEQEGSGAHQVAVERLDAPALGGRGGPDGDAPEGVEHGHPGGSVVERHRGVVDDLDALDRPDVRGHLAGLRGRVEDALDVVADGLGIEGRAVLEDDITPQGEGPLVRHRVRRPARRQCRVEPAVRADDEQRVGDHVVDEPRRLVRLDVAVERGRLARGGPGDDEMVCGLVAAGSGVGGARGEQRKGNSGRPGGEETQRRSARARHGYRAAPRSAGAPSRSAFVPSFNA